MDYIKTLEHLYSLSRFDKLGLTRIRALLKRLGNPEKSLSIIHVAGTNGKGSVCAMISAILQEAGFTVGMFTSPHLVRFNERFRINDKEISRRDVVKYYTIVNKNYDRQSYFEFITAMAYLYFSDNKVDYAVMETGLGGRLDATNVAQPRVSVITNVGLEHQHVLGTTLKKIASEKAGIIKNNVPVVTGATGTALTEIQRIATARKSPLIQIKSYNFKTNLSGRYQEANADIAVTTVKALLDLNDTIVKNGLLHVSWPGRLQYLSKNVLADCAHNVSGTRVLVDYLKTLNKKVILVFGCSSDKDYKEMIKLLLPFTKKIILTKANVEYRKDKALNPARIGDYLDALGTDYLLFDTSKAALREAQKERGLILVTGSIFLVGRAMALCTQ